MFNSLFFHLTFELKDELLLACLHVQKQSCFLEGIPYLIALGFTMLTYNIEFL